MQIPETVTLTSSFVNVFRDKYHIFGSPSSFTRYLGNPHESLVKLRAALYYHMGIRDTVKEKFPNHESQIDKVLWIDKEVMPNPKYIKMLKKKTPKSIFNAVFPLRSHFRDKKEASRLIINETRRLGRYTGLPSKRINKNLDLNWNNHLNSLLAMICEIKFFFQNQYTFTQLMEKNKFSKSELKTLI